MERFNLYAFNTNAEVIEAMETEYNKLQNANTTSKRKTCLKHMVALYDTYELLHKLWIYVKDAYHYAKCFVRRVIIEVNQIVKHWSHDYFYIMRFYKHDGSFLFDKVGSAQNPQTRLGQHLNYYSEADRGEILLCVDTGTVAASSLEDSVRDYFIRKYGFENFISKDRFKCQVNIPDIKAKIPTCLERLLAAQIPA